MIWWLIALLVVIAIGIWLVLSSIPHDEP